MASKSGKAFHIFKCRCARLLDEIDRRRNKELIEPDDRFGDERDLPAHTDENGSGRVWSF